MNVCADTGVRWASFWGAKLGEIAFLHISRAHLRERRLPSGFGRATQTPIGVIWSAVPKGRNLTLTENASSPFQLRQDIALTMGQ